jgi:hypothetical protein
MKYILKMLLFVVISISAFTNANAQMRADGKWYFPDSIKNLCLNYEQNIVAMFRGMIERNRDYLDPTSKNDKSNYVMLNESTTKAIQEYEMSWDRLGCVYIIYGVKK